MVGGSPIVPREHDTMPDDKTKKARVRDRIDVQCRKIAGVCRDRARIIEDADVRAEYEYLARGFSQFELATDTDESAKSY